MMSITRNFFSIIFILCSFSTWAQDSQEDSDETETYDTSAFQLSDVDGFVTIDTASSLPDSSSRSRMDTLVRYDETDVAIRKAEEGKIDDLKKDPDLDYTITPSVESIWSRILWWLASLFISLFASGEDGAWIRYLIWGIAVAALVFVILKLLKIDALKLFYSGQGKSITYTAIDENIHEMDFDKLIADAVAAKDYRLAIRLQFLQALKILSDKHLIHWHPGKTNHDYMLELGKSNLREGFTELNEYFEYAWYGNFPIAPDLFGKVQTIFNTWRKQA
jgi:hypothetical protein